MRETGYEGSVEVAESQETAHFFNRCWFWPFRDPFDFDWVHLYLSVTDDHAKVLDFFLVKSAFFGFEKEVMISEFS